MTTSPFAHDQVTDDAPLTWDDRGTLRSARWSSESQGRPSRVVVGDDALTAKEAFRLVSAGTAILWQGDFQNARQMVRALARRIDRPARPGRSASPPEPSSLASAFHTHRRERARRAQLLGLLLVPLEADYVVPLRRAPDVAEACTEAFGPSAEPSVRSLQEIQGAVGASEWRRKGVEVPALGARIHPHYGVFSPVRGEYLDLVADAPLPQDADGFPGTTADSGDGELVAFDIGTGTGVIAAILARRGMHRVVATDQEARAVRCARETMDRLGIADRVDVSETDLFPPGRAPLVVCNPPWLPAEVTSSLDAAVYDPGNRMLSGFLTGLPDHLEPGGEGWLIISDIAERLGLRSRDELLRMIADAGLVVVGRLDTRPRHKRADDAADALHAARSAEVTSLWRLRTDEVPHGQRT